MKAGAWGEDEDPILKRFSIQGRFPRRGGDRDRQGDSDILPAEGFEDLTGLDIFSIDDENTEDIDDAISVRETPDGTEVGIHISNVAALVPKWSEADDGGREARGNDIPA